MDRDLIKAFYLDIHTRDAVLAFLSDTLKEEATSNVFKGKPVDGYKEAMDCIKNSFAKLHDTYGERPTRKERALE